jgi:hypothetical protein
MNLPLPVFLPSIATDPIHQFKIFPLIDWSAGGYNLAFTNSSFWMLSRPCWSLASSAWPPRAPA